MTAFFKICLVALLASASVVSAMNCKEIHPDEDMVYYGEKFSEGPYDSGTIFNVFSQDGTTVRSLKDYDDKKRDRVFSIYNKKKGGPTGVAFKCDLIEDNQTTSTYYRYFRVKNATPACDVAKNDQLYGNQKEVVREASYFFQTKN
jgi:hypothetical protein